MSWDLYFVKTKNNRERIEDCGEENLMPVSRTDIRAAITEFYQLYPQELTIDTDDMHYFTVQSASGVTELFLGKEEEELLRSGFLLSFHGSAEQTAFLEYLASRLDGRLFDIGNGEFWEPEKSDGFESWKAYRDKVIGKNRE